MSDYCTEIPLSFVQISSIALSRFPDLILLLIIVHCVCFCDKNWLKTTTATMMIMMIGNWWRQSDMGFPCLISSFIITIITVRQNKLHHFIFAITLSNLFYSNNYWYTYTVFQKSDAKIQITITMAHIIRINYPPVSYTHLTLPTNREV